MAIKYKWLAGQLKERIERQLKQGENKLPTEAELSKLYHVSRQTVRMALELLETQGLIRRRQGSGSYLTGLLARERNEIVLLLSSAHDYIYPALAADLRAGLEPEGFSCRLLETGNCFARERELLTSLLKEPPRAVIAEGCLTSLPNPNLDLYRLLARRGCAFLFLYGYYQGFPDCLFVKDDNFQGSALLTRRLAALGHRTIGALLKWDDIQGPERFQGFAETLRELNLPLDDNRVCWYGSRELATMSDDQSFLLGLVRGPLAGCSAVLCYNDLAAYHLVGAFARAGIPAAERPLLAAFDNTYLGSSFPALSLSHRPREIAQLAAQTLLKRLRGQPARCQEVGWELSERGTLS